MNRADAQAKADRIRILGEELRTPEVRAVLELTGEQENRFDSWSVATLNDLAGQFDVDTTAGQKGLSWGMRIASTLGGLAICAAVVLFFTRYWGYLDTPVQVMIVMLLPLVALGGTEFAARRERTLYFAGLMALVSLAAFILNLEILGTVFNIASTENALLAWGVFSMLVAYRYRLRPLLVAGLGFLISFSAAFFTARLGHRWFDFGERPEQLAICGLVVFGLAFRLPHRLHGDFAAVYRLVGALTFFLSVLCLAEFGVPSFLRWEPANVERLYELVGLASSAGVIWMGIWKRWNGLVNTGAAFFVLFLFCRLYHWWWDWMPAWLFFGIIGLFGIVLVTVFRRLRMRAEAA